MKTNELKIGNWIIEPNQDDDKPFQIWGLYYEIGNEKINNLPVAYFKPIPLTEEWLLKFGFEVILETVGWAKDNVEIGFCTKTGFYIIQTSKDIKYVHQLQNLYFALTGEELEIK